MAGSSKDVDAARRALERARGDLEKKLAAEPAWAALVQLEARIGRGEPSPGIEYDDLRARLMQQLDGKVADWRSLPAINAAIAALDLSDAGQSRDVPTGRQPPPVPGRSTMAPPPLPAERPPQQQASARTRYGPATSRPSSPQDDRPASHSPPRAQPPPLPREPGLRREPERPEPRRPPTTGSRIASALGLGGDGPARLTAIEAEIERMMRRDMGTRDNEDGIAPLVPQNTPAAPSMSARDTPDRRLYPTAASVGPVLHGEEAEVEIVGLGPSPVRAEPRPVARLADRLNRVEPPAEGETDEPIPVIEAIEEAEVEIVLLDETAQGQSGGLADKGPPAGAR